MDKGILLSLYKSLVRPHLDYCIHAWRPYFLKDMELLEKIQRRAIKMIEGFRNMTLDFQFSGKTRYSYEWSKVCFKNIMNLDRVIYLILILKVFFHMSSSEKVIISISAVVAIFIYSVKSKNSSIVNIF